MIYDPPLDSGEVRGRGGLSVELRRLGRPNFPQIAENSGAVGSLDDGIIRAFFVGTSEQ